MGPRQIDAVVERVFDRILKKHSSQEEGNVYMYLIIKLLIATQIYCISLLFA